MKYFLLILFFLVVNTFSQDIRNSLNLDSTNIPQFFEQFCQVAVKDEFEKNIDYQARIKSIDEEKIGFGLYLEFIKEISYYPTAFSYDAEFERYFMAHHIVGLSVTEEFNNFIESDQMVFELGSKEILMSLDQKKMGLFGAYNNYCVASILDYDDYSNLKEDELASRIFIYMPVDEAKAFKRNKSKIAMKIRLRVDSYADSKIIKKSEFYPNTTDKLTDHTYYIIKGDIEEIMFYDVQTNKIYTTYSHN